MLAFALFNVAAAFFLILGGEGAAAQGERNGEGRCLRKKGGWGWDEGREEKGKCEG